MGRSTDIDTEITAENRDIAITGMAGIFPGAGDLKTFWSNILNRVNSIREVDPERWRLEDLFDADPRCKDHIYSKWGGFLDDIPFDPTEFGIPPVTLKSIDAMQLLALKVAKKALEDAGFDKAAFPKDRTTVIFGAGGMHDQCIDYVFRTMLMHYLPRITGLSDNTRIHLLDSFNAMLPEWTEDSFPGILSNVVAGRVANRMDLHGSNFTVDAACASSLAALDVGISKLRSGQADAAVVGAVDLTDNVMGFMAFAKTMVLSPDGKSRPFDDRANGIVISEGVAALVLKRLSDAQNAGDRIYAVIKGIGSSSDGRNRSLTAPHPEGQLLALQRAYQDAAVAPESVGLVEAHGTGTVVGDQSEFSALNLAFGQPVSHQKRCAVGSVKSNIGHTKMAAGLAGLMKGVMALDHKILPATIGIEKPNSRIDLGSGRFYLNTENRPWFKSVNESPRRCGISAFGFGGTNFHAVLEEYTQREETPVNLTAGAPQIFIFSAKNKTDLFEIVEGVDEVLKHAEDTDLKALAAALYLKNRETDTTGHLRLNIVAVSVAELKQSLNTAAENLQKGGSPSDGKGIYFSDGPCSPGRVCFLFPGQGSQKVNMLKDLLIAFPQCRKAFEQADTVLNGWFEFSISEAVYPPSTFSKEEEKRRTETLNRTQIAQPAMAAADIAALDFLRQFGLFPDFAAGHSFGEIMALHAAGTVGRDDVIRLAAIRGKISQAASSRTDGKMAALMTDVKDSMEIIKASGTLARVANINTPRQTVIGGSARDIEKCMETASEKRIGVKLIPVTAAFHTDLMKTAAAELGPELKKITFEKPGFPVYSNTTGDPYPSSVSDIRKLLTRHITEPVDFIREIENIYAAGARCFIEVGPGKVMSGMVDQILINRPHTTIPLDSPGRSGILQAAHFLAQAQSIGIPIDLSLWFASTDESGRSLETVLEQAARVKNPPPLTWRISEGKARPWYPASSANVFDKRTDNSKRFRQEPLKVLTLNPRPQAGPIENEIMQKDTIPNTTQSTAVFFEDRNLIFKIQANMDQFMELQRSHQHLMERYLDIQQQLVNAVLNGNGNGSGNAHNAVSPEVRAAGYNPVNVPVPVVANIPPKPVLPKLKPVGVEKTAFHKSENLKPAAVTESAVPATSDDIASTSRFQADLLRTVSELTGYPEEMLGLDAHLEADLGIDSIKRVEVFSLLEEHHPLLESHDEGAVLEELANLNTLRKIIGWYETNSLRMQEKEKQSAKK